MATGERDLFFQLFWESDQECENQDCGIPLTLQRAQFHHLKTKGAHPALRLDPDNIVVICMDCHVLAHSKGNSALNLPTKYDKYL